MNSLKIPYKKKRDVVALVAAILFGLYAVYGFLKDVQHWSNYAALICTVGYVLVFLFDKKTYYLTLRNGTLKTGKLMAKRINLSELHRILQTENAYILEANNTKLTIDTSLIDPNTLTELNRQLKDLPVEWK